MPTIAHIEQFCIFYLTAFIAAIPPAVIALEWLRVAALFVEKLRHWRLFIIDLLQFIIFSLFLLFAAQGQAPFGLILKPFYHFTPIISSWKPSGASLSNASILILLAEMSSMPSLLISTKAEPTKMQPVESGVPVFGFLLPM